MTKSFINHKCSVSSFRDTNRNRVTLGFVRSHTLENSLEYVERR